MKKITTLLVLITVAIILQSSIKHLNYGDQPPAGYAGSVGDYCSSCHNSFGLNSGGGGVSVSGLPNGEFVAGRAYDFSLSITHDVADRRRWGFSILAVNSLGQKVGTFSSTNSNAATNGDELSHFSAVVTSPQSSYTYNGLKWIAPVAPSNADKNVTFYYVGNAANQSGSSDGDFIYAGSTSIVLPIILNSFTASVSGTSVLLQWQSVSELNSSNYTVERSENGQVFYPIATIKAAANQSTVANYSYTDENPAYFDKPIYYRLKLVDRDNTYKYSAVVNARLQAGSTVVKNVYPSFIRSNAPIHAVIVSDKAQSIDITLLDGSGKQIQRLSETLVAGTNNISFNISNSVTNGINFLKFSGANVKQTIAVIVQK